MNIDVIGFVKNIFIGIWTVIQIPGPEVYLIVFGILLIVGGAFFVLKRWKNR